MAFNVFICHLFELFVSVYINYGNYYPKAFLEKISFFGKIEQSLVYWASEVPPEIQGSFV